MGVKFNDRITPEGKRLQKALEDLNNLEVGIGFQRGKASEDGVDMADIAAWNEYGTVHSPSRPFIRKTMDENSGKIDAMIENVKDGVMSGKDPQVLLNQVGVAVKGLMQEKIVNGTYEPNAPSTIKKKGSSKPLIDTGQMRQSVNYVVRRRGSAGK